MELQVNEQGQETKLHGTYGFPVNLGHKRISAYETGSFPWHWHNEIELTLVLAGEVEYRVNDSSYLLKEGEGLFCNANALHTGSMHAGADCDYLSLTFHPRFLYGYEGSVIRTKYVESIIESSALSSLQLTGEIPWQREALDSLRRIYGLFREKPELYELEVQRLLLGIWAGLYRNYGDEVQRAPVEDAEKIERLRALLSFLHGHYAEKVTLEDAARQVNLCKSECCRFFKKQMGISIFEYLLEYRVAQSMDLLKKGYTVAETSERCGFSTPAYFTKVFHARTGRSPSGYRKESREN
ncbi:helix-turn-helix domain-containing protein [uncultured Neglectibacter sp.]|uniref:helix-turn-helix domain-containing protein n=1 Tax=uncultured Neglectibacter sp. TaxID=1924108 RepID=UPI0034DF71C8